MTSTPGGSSGGPADPSPQTPSMPSFPRNEQPVFSPPPQGQTLRRGSTASSIRSVQSAYSIGGSLDTGANSNSVFEPGQNAISTLLQPPIVRTGLQPHAAAPASSAHRPPTSRDIPPVTLTNIPHVDASEFKPYLAQIGAMYEQLQRARESGGGGGEAVVPGTTRRGSRFGGQDWTAEPHDQAHLKPSIRTPVRRKGSLASLGSLSSPLDAPGPPPRRPSLGYARRTGQGPPPLNTIPNVYFEEDFHLENPRTFDIVSERSEVMRQQQQQHPPPQQQQQQPRTAAGAASAEDKDGIATNGSAIAATPRKALATNAILQEKLSWYMDTIEMHLISSISTASTTFFSALGSLRELHAEAAESVERIGALRQDLRVLDDEIAATGLDIMRKRRRRENMGKLNGAVRQLRQIVEGVIGCEALVDEGEVDRALDRIDEIEWLIAGEPEAPAAVNGLSAPQPPAPAQRPASQSQSQLQPHSHSQPQPHSAGQLDMRGASALQGVGGDMETLRFRIGKIYETRFQTQLLGDLRRHLDGIALNEVLMRWSGAAQRAKGNQSRVPSIFPTYMAGTDELRALIYPNVLGLARARHITIAASGYRESVLREIRSVIRRPLPSSNDDDNESVVSASTRSGGRGRARSNQEKSTVLARNLRALQPEDAEEMLSGIYVRLTETMRRLTTQVKLMLDVAGALGGGPNDGAGGPPGSAGLRSPPLPPPLPRSPLMSPSLVGRQAFEIQEELHLAFELPKLLGSAVDTAHEKISRILRVRADQTKNLSLPRFLRYYTLNLLFVNECEAISGQSTTPLKALVTGHIKDFVQQHGDGENRKLAQGMESDQWSAVDFADPDAAALAEILACSTKDPAGWAENTNNIWQPFESADGEGGPEENAVGQKIAPPHPRPLPELNGDKKEKDKEKEKMRPAMVESEPFVLPQSAILCLRGIIPYLHLVSSIPLLTAEIATTLVAYLQLFNSRCTQLILGAGATRSAGLKNIAAKHLALASQALGFVATLVPYMREFIRRNLGGSAATTGGGGGGGGGGGSSVMAEFDRVRHLMQEHQDTIYQKIIEIMRNRAGAAAREMSKIDWDKTAAGSAGSAGPAGSASAVHAYVETLSRDTTVLHRVLTRHLPDPAVQMIMLPVFESYKEQFGHTLREAKTRTETGRASMLRDVEYIIAKISKIDGFSDTGDYLLKIVKSKEVSTTSGRLAAAVAAAAAAAPRLAVKREAAAAASPQLAAKPEEAAAAAGLPKLDAKPDAKPGEVATITSLELDPKPEEAATIAQPNPDPPPQGAATAASPKLDGKPEEDAIAASPSMAVKPDKTVAAASPRLADEPGEETAATASLKQADEPGEAVGTESPKPADEPKESAPAPAIPEGLEPVPDATESEGAPAASEDPGISETGS